MKHKEFINRVLRNESADLNNLADFIVDYIFCLNHPEESRLLQSIPQIMQGVTSGVFNIRHMINEYCSKSNIPIYTLADLKTNTILKIYI